MFLPDCGGYDELMARFRWEIPEKFNMGRAVADHWAAREPQRLALEHYELDGRHRRMRYGELADLSSRFAASLVRLGVERGDRVAILLPQCFETVIAHLGIYKMGGVALPLALLFGADALDFRLKDSGAQAIVTNAYGHGKIEPLLAGLLSLRHVVTTEPGDGATLSFQALIAAEAGDFVPLDTSKDDPALMIYTSGTTGPPKGALHAHRVLAGHVPGVQAAQEMMPQPGDKFWTPSDWAWAGGLLNCLLPGLMLGVPVVSSPAQKFDADLAYRIMADLCVTNAFIPPTALRLMAAIDNPRERYALRLRAIGSAGETLGRETYDWAKRALGLTVNEFYGQTECNIVLGSIVGFGVSRAGAIGKTMPGHTVAVIDEVGRVLPSGKVGQIAVRRPDPVMFLGYWNNPEATEKKFIGDWMLTGDQGVMDAEGYVDFFGRDDDVITSSGYRIGPTEIEDCLISHPAVRLAAAVGKPDALRTEIVKAYVVLADGVIGDEALKRDISDWVRHRLSMHEYPREVEFIDALPLTTTGKVIRRELRDRAARQAAGEIRRRNSA